jgi:DNA helicase II / ATP-dependent DNA helicase PcrA
MFIADLHIHSRFSRACSKDCDIEHLSWWARRKGLTVLGTGDFTHPAWAAELKDTLVEAEPGLFRVRPDLERRLDRDTPASCAGTVRFMLSVEISTIYRRDERTRKVHHLLYAPSFEAADRITAALAKVGNLASDGRPILGLDSRDLLEITLDAGPGCFLVPAHVWTPWFAVLGSKSGFDAVRDCYADLAGHIFAVETGLSSDPAMNWTCSSLDAYRLVSNSDAHSPPALGREATVFGTDLDYFAMAEALRTGRGLDGTLEFFPEEGKYHLDGHRKCGVRIEPEQTTALADQCPACGKPLTVGVLHRVAELADRPAGFRPDGAAGFTCLVQLPQIIGEILGTGPKSKKVAAETGRLTGALGPELSILREVPLDDLRRTGGARFAEAIGRLRRGEVITQAGYDGEYGTVRLFGPDELDGSALFAMNDLAAPAQADKNSAERSGVSPAAPRPRARRGGAAPASSSPGFSPGATGSVALGTGSVLDGLDPDQRAAATAAGPLLIIAGPGTGKTRTLTHRIAHQVTELGRPARQFLAITFTRRAAQEMRDRLAGLGAGRADDIVVTTFHGLGLRILREHASAAGLPDSFGVADEAALVRVAAELTGSEREGRTLAGDPQGRPALRAELIARGLVDFDGLTELTAALLAREPQIAAGLAARWPFVSVDEYQDIDPVQYELVRALAGDGAGLTAIGDPDQAIYGFRGADVGIFGRFAADFPGATRVELTRNYRSSPAIVTAALQAIAPSTLVPSRAAAAVSVAAGAPEPGVVSLHEAADEHAEAAWIAAAVDQLLGGASFHSLDSGRADGHGHGKLALSDIAVLYRTDAQAAALGQALTRAGLPYQKRSHDLLARRPAVADIVREMALVNPAGDVLAQLTAAVRALAAAHGERDATVLDIRAAGEVLAPLARRCGADAERFRTEISLGAETDALDPRAEAIPLLTLHAAKGLEFDVVFLAGCERGLLPLRLPGSGPLTPEETAEERRLLFVGMTRARGQLVLTCAARRIRHGTEAAAGRSPFLASVNPGLLGPAAPARARRSADRQLRLL